MRCEVLGLIDDETYVGDAASPDICQRCDHQLFIFHGLRKHLVLLVLFTILALDEFQVVPQWLHVGIKLRLDISGQKPQVLVAQRHDGPCHIDLLEVSLLFQCPGKGQECFPRTGNALHRNQLHIGI